MENQSYITILLIIIISLVILIDYILKSRKKTQDKSVKRFIEKEKFGKKKWFNLKIFSWILKRKKNISISVLIIFILKITIHYFFANDACQRIYVDDELVLGGSRTISKIGCAEFKDYVNAVLFDVRIYPFIEGSSDIFRWDSFVLNARIELFIPITLIYILIVWFFNDKIKAK